MGTPKQKKERTPPQRKPAQKTQTYSQPQTPSLPQPKKKKNDKITSSTTATSSNYSSPTKTKKYPSWSCWIPTFPKINFSLTNLNPQATFTAPFYGQRFNTTSIITNCNEASVKVSFYWSPTCSKCILLLPGHTRTSKPQSSSKKIFKTINIAKDNR